MGGAAVSETLMGGIFGQMGGMEPLPPNSPEGTLMVQHLLRCMTCLRTTTAAVSYLPTHTSVLPPATGTPAVTSRHMDEGNVLTIVGFIDEAVTLAQAVKKSTGG